MKNLSEKLIEKNKTLLEQRDKVMAELWKSLNIEKFKNDIVVNFDILIDSIEYKHNKLVIEIELENINKDETEMYKMYSNPLINDEYFCKTIQDVLFMYSFGYFEVNIRKIIGDKTLKMFVILTLLERKTNG